MIAPLLRIHRKCRAPLPSASRAGAARFARAAGGCAVQFHRPACSVPTAIAPVPKRGSARRGRTSSMRVRCTQGVESASTERLCSSFGKRARCGFRQDTPDVVECGALAFRAALLRLSDQRCDLLVAESPRPLRDFRQRQVLFLEQAYQLDARDVALGVTSTWTWRAGRWQQPLLHVEVHRSGRNIRPFTQFVDVEITQGESYYNSRTFYCQNSPIAPPSDEVCHQGSDLSPPVKRPGYSSKLLPDCDRAGHNTSQLMPRAATSPRSCPVVRDA